MKFPQIPPLPPFPLWGSLAYRVVYTGTKPIRETMVDFFFFKEMSLLLLRGVYLVLRVKTAVKTELAKPEKYLLSA